MMARKLEERQQEYDILSVRYTKTGSYLVTGGADGIIRYYSSGRSLHSRSFGDVPLDPFAERIPVTCIEPFPSVSVGRDHWCLVSYSNGTIKLWNLIKDKIVATITEDQQILGLASDPHTDRFLTYGDDMSIKLYDEETLKLVHVYSSSHIMGKTDGHTSRIFSVDYHPKNSHEFISGGWDNTIQFWDTRVPQSIRFIAGPHVCGEALRIRPNGKQLLVGSYRKETPLQLYEYKSGQLLLNVDVDGYNNAMVYCVGWADDDICFVGSADPTLFRIITMSDVNCIAYYHSLATAVYSADCKKITVSEYRSKEQRSEDVPVPRRSGLVNEVDSDIGTALKCAFCNGNNLFEVQAYILPSQYL